MLQNLVGGPRGVVGSDSPLDPLSRKWETCFFGFLSFLIGIHGSGIGPDSGLSV